MYLLPPMCMPCVMQGTGHLRGGALQRSSTSVVALDELNTERDSSIPLDDVSSHGPDSDDEAIFADFQATQLGGSSGGGSAPSSGGNQAGSSSSSSASQHKSSSKPGGRLVAALRGRSSSKQHLQQPAQHADTAGLPPSRISAPSGHSNGAHTGAGVYMQRSRSTSFRSTSAPGHRQELSDGGAGPGVVPGVAVARIQGSWLSHLNIDNQR